MTDLNSAKQQADDDLTWLARNVHECLSYNKETGEFTWKSRPLSHFSDHASHKSWNAKRAGKVAGHRNNHEENKYVTIRIKGVSYGAHRLAMLMSFGYMPEEVDHINGVQYDNRLANLMPCTRAENSKNLPRRKGRKVTGISIDKGKFRVRINVDGVEIAIGNFIDFFEACCARKSAERKYGFSLLHGRNQFSPDSSETESHWRDTLERRPQVEAEITDPFDPEFRQEPSSDDWHKRGELPPVGTECEVLLDGMWERVFIVGFSRRGQPVAENRFGAIYEHIGCQFRPIPTERERVAAELVDVMMAVPVSDRKTASESYMSMALAIYDHLHPESKS